MANSKTRVAALLAAALIIAAGVTWYLASPEWTLHEMKAAADANDPDALNSYIDYPALRESLKAELTARMVAEAGKDKSGLGALGTAFGSAVMGPVIDGLASPAGMRAALIASRVENASPAASALRVPEKPVIVRRNFSEFVVTAKDRPNSGLVFRRHGLFWMLSGVE